MDMAQNDVYIYRYIPKKWMKYSKVIQHFVGPDRFPFDDP